MSGYTTIMAYKPSNSRIVKKLNYTICNNRVKVMERDLMKIPSLFSADICHPVASTTKAS
jgi:predicted metallopeptidase